MQTRAPSMVYSAHTSPSASASLVTVAYHSTVLGMDGLFPVPHTYISDPVCQNQGPMLGTIKPHQHRKQRHKQYYSRIGIHLRIHMHCPIRSYL